MGLVVLDSDAAKLKRKGNAVESIALGGLWTNDVTNLS